MTHLHIPTNPAYDPEQPTAGYELANPVAVNNQQVLYANEAITIAQDHCAVLDELREVKLNLRIARRAREDLVRQILLEHPPTSGNDTKNNKLIDAYVARMALEHGYAERLRAYEREEAALEDKLEGLELDTQRCTLAMNAIKLASQNAMTFLSYVKDEAKRSRYGL